MKEKQKKQITHWLSVIIVGIALGLGLQFVRAWTEPTQAPPNGNVGAPINTGATKQTKAGDICTNASGSEVCLSNGGGGGLNWNSPAVFTASGRPGQVITTPTTYKLCVQEGEYIEVSGMCIINRNSDGTWTVGGYSMWLGQCGGYCYTLCRMYCYN